MLRVRIHTTFTAAWNIHPRYLFFIDGYDFTGIEHDEEFTYLLYKEKAHCKCSPKCSKQVAT